MGCGCKGSSIKGLKRPRNTRISANSVSPARTAPSAPTGQSVTPINSPPVSSQSTSSVSPSGLTRQRREIERKRRNAILTRLGKR